MDHDRVNRDLGRVQLGRHFESLSASHLDRQKPRAIQADSRDDDTAYADEPLADVEWLERCQEEMKANEELERSLKILSFFCLDRSRIVRLLVPAHEQMNSRVSGKPETVSQLNKELIGLVCQWSR